MIDIIIKIAAGITATGVILGLGVKAWNVLNRVNGKIKGVDEKLTTLEEHSNENYMSLLRLTIMSNEMPIGERIVAGHKYLNNNGNGEVKQFLKREFNITDTVDEAEHYKK
jgi:hypothetical protein